MVIPALHVRRDGVEGGRGGGGGGRLAGGEGVDGGDGRQRCCCRVVFALLWWLLLLLLLLGSVAVLMSRLRFFHCFDFLVFLFFFCQNDFIAPDRLEGFKVLEMEGGKERWEGGGRRTGASNEEKSPADPGCWVDRWPGSSQRHLIPSGVESTWAGRDRLPSAEWTLNLSDTGEGQAWCSAHS